MSKSKAIEHICRKLDDEKITYVLIHQSALHAWGLDDNAVVNVVDVLLVNDSDFNKLSLSNSKELGSFTESNLFAQPVRFWSTLSLALDNTLDVVESDEYDCYILAPELVLDKLVYSPDFKLLGQARARLAASTNVDNLSTDDLEVYSYYVR